MKHWKCPIERPQIFARNDDGKIRVTLVRGNVFNPGGRGALPGIRKKAIESATEQLALDRKSPVTWWIFYHSDGVRGFQGAGGPNGGVAINAYPKGEGLVDLDADLATPDLAASSVKGTIHEFGHALGLPHIGPLPALNLGNSLMGPVNRAYWKRRPGNDPKVYLNEACAVMLKAHPIFRNQPPTERAEMPAKIEVENLKVIAADGGKTISVTGKMSSSIAAHSIVIVDSERNRYGDYWSRAYSAALKEGSFTVKIDEPFEAGTLFLGFCFNNGSNSGGKKSFQGGSKFTIEYRQNAGEFEFEPADAFKVENPSGAKELTMQSGGLQRTYVLHLPEDMAEDVPLVFVLHGYGSKAEPERFGMNAVADANGFAVCYPQGEKDGRGKACWNVGYPFQSDMKIDDVAFLSELASDLQITYKLSAQNTFCTGMSNGGEMCYQLACQRPDIFKAIAPIAGLMMEWLYKECDCASPVPVMEIHGTKDRTSVWEGDLKNEGGWGAYVSVPLAIQYWVAENRCTEVVTEPLPDIDKSDGSHIVVQKHLNGHYGSEVWLYKVIDGGHDWPGRSGNNDINTSEEIWKFFSKFLK